MKPLREPRCGNWIGHWKVNLITPESSTRDVRLHLINNALILWKQSGHKAVLTHVSPALCMCLIACRFNSGRYWLWEIYNRDAGCVWRTYWADFLLKTQRKKVQLGVFVLLARGSIDGFRIKQMILNRNGSNPEHSLTSLKIIPSEGDLFFWMMAENVHSHNHRVKSYLFM